MICNPFIKLTGSGGLTLATVTNIRTLTASGKVYVKWTDPEDLVVADTTLAAWGGTLLVRKAGSAPASRKDGTIVLDSKIKNAYQNSYFCDSGLTDGVQYFYKFFPYTTSNAYTDSPDDEFNATPHPVALGNVSNMSAVAAGNGKLAIKYTDPAATVVTNGITVATWAKTVVVVKKGGYATGSDDPAAAYRKVVTTRNQYSSSALTVTGLTNSTTYYVTFFPTSTDGAVNTNTANRVSGVANRLTIATVPSQSGTLTYNGQAQTPSWSNYDSSKMTLEVTGQTNAGSHTAKFTPKDDYMWSDGTTTAKTVTWKINKAAGSLSLNKTSVTLNATTRSQTVAVTRAGNGAITATCSDTSVATVSVSGTNVVISSVNNKTGTATITVKVAEGSNHLAPANKTVAVTAKFITLNDTSWADIRTISEADQGANYWAVGDCKAITINGTVGQQAINGTYYVYILGFNHNEAMEGKGIHFGGFKTAMSGGTDICLVDHYYSQSQSYNGTKYFQINHRNSSQYGANYGGWAACDMRYDILGSTNKAPSGYGSDKTASATGNNPTATCATSPVANTLMAALPADLRAVMQPMTKYTDNNGNGSNTWSAVTETTDYLPLLAEFEIFGERSYANKYENSYQEQYAYYSSGNSKVKHRHSSTGSAANWWERSTAASTTGFFCYVDTGGNAERGFASSSYGLAPVFKV